MRLIQLSTRELRRHPGRTLLTFLSIVMGVAAIVAVALVDRATRQAYAELAKTLAGRAELQVVSRAGGGFEQGWADRLEQSPGVRLATPAIERSTIVYLGEGQRAVVLALGIDPEREQAADSYELVDGQWFEGNRGVMLDAAFARQAGIEVGDEIRMLVRRGLVRMPVMGLLRSRASQVLEQGFVYMTIPTTQLLFRIRGEVDKLYLVLEEGANPAEVERSVAQLLPPELSVEPPPQRSAMAEESQFTMRQGLNLASSLSVVVAAFIILNTFLMNVSERRRQFGILRSIGATRRQVLWLLLREGLWLGLAGTIVGLVLGVAGSIVLLRAMEGLLSATLPLVELSPGPLILGVVIGLGVTLLASFYPAYLAGKLSPLASMRGVLTEDFAKPSPFLSLIGLVLFVVGGAVIIGSRMGHVPFEWTIPASLALLISLVFLLPLIVVPMSRVVAMFITPVWGFTAELGRRQVLRRRTRSVLTMGVVFVAAATGVGMGLTVLNEAEDVDRWMDRSLQGDFFVRAMVPSLFSSQTIPLPEGLEEELREIPGVLRVSGIRSLRTSTGEQEVIVVARDLRTSGPVRLDLRAGDLQTLREQMQQNAVVIGTVLAHRAGLEVGDSLPLQTNEGPVQLPIVGIANDYSAAGLIVYMHSEVADHFFGPGDPDVFIIDADQEKLASVRQQLEATARENGVLVQSHGEVQQIVAGIKNGIVGSLWGLLVMGFIVSAFGIANTLAMNVLEQTRELGMMRVVAMTRSQLRRMILSQAIIMGLVGLIPGLLVGLFMAYTTNQTTKSAFGHSAEFVFRPGLILGIFLIACLIVLIAAWIPAVRASRLKLSLALHED